MEIFPRWDVCPSRPPNQTPTKVGLPHIVSSLEPNATLTSLNGMRVNKIFSLGKEGHKDEKWGKVTRVELVVRMPLSHLKYYLNSTIDGVFSNCLNFV
jgi:hypothetical protein